MTVINRIIEEKMLFLLVTSIVIQSSHGQFECGKIVTGVNFALEGAGDWNAPWVVSMGIYEEVPALHCCQQCCQQWCQYL